MPGNILPRSFYRRDPRLVAVDLLNRSSSPQTGSGHRRNRAYCGDDPAAHGYAADRAQCDHVWPTGQMYVYFTYGMHWCCNAVVARSMKASGVLLRAGTNGGLQAMRAARPKAQRDEVCAAVGT
jgi:DNA-3-methyladenine glycosylase